MVIDGTLNSTGQRFHRSPRTAASPLVEHKAKDRRMKVPHAAAEIFSAGQDRWPG
jgi:hypothetical protein